MLRRGSLRRAVDRFNYTVTDIEEFLGKYPGSVGRCIETPAKSGSVDLENEDE